MPSKPFFLAAGLVTLLFAIGCKAKNETSKIPDAPDLRDSGTVPEDFEVIAGYSAGFGPWMSWTYKIHADGNVAQEHLGGRGSGKDATKQTKLNKEEIDTLWAKVKSAQFFNLKQDYKATITDQDTLTLKITRSKQTHQVAIYGYQDLPAPDRNDVNRFLGIWAEVIRLIPPPNPEQTPDLYKPLQ
jgi:hypothetical protein